MSQAFLSSRNVGTPALRGAYSCHRQCVKCESRAEHVSSEAPAQPLPTISRRGAVAALLTIAAVSCQTQSAVAETPGGATSDSNTATIDAAASGGDPATVYFGENRTSARQDGVPLYRHRQPLEPVLPTFLLAE